MDPTGGLMDQLTAVFGVFETIAISCSLNPAATLDLLDDAGIWLELSHVRQSKIVMSTRG